MIWVRTHAWQRALERFLPEGTTQEQAIEYVRKMYGEATVLGTSAHHNGNTHVLSHRRGFLIVEYEREHVVVVSIMKPGTDPRMLLEHPDAEEEDAWAAWVRRNPAGSG